MTDQLALLPDDLRVTPKFKVSGRVDGLFATLSPEDFQTTARQVLELGLEGIPGDRHGGFTRKSGGREPWYPRGTEMCNERQISLLSPQELSLVAERMGIAGIRPEWIGGNFLISGIANLSKVPPRTRLVFEGGAVIRVDGDNVPCRIAGASIAAHYPDRDGLDLMFPKVARGVRGLVGFVEKPGTVEIGETMTAHIPEQWIYERA
ncbi:MOSC domain-containing protein [Roseibium salinum]|uniref:Molybdenum cofactor sulfurase n=1 Tax=Roseibium salinum TaxID=1604349 RepID=A0ABT3R2V6_9HYPH|nr:molybdenum cofactor sulfurase [Roseibium sp. DSM 29163]MCX2723466.1 molybdenum cofactor sulfurase [Roseibium sp. DSM 29163]MDN3718651.1 molybdenum cofactor sulfurase [Roseibium salinum]